MSMVLCISVFHPRELPHDTPISNEYFSLPLTDGKPHYLLQFPNRSYAGHLTFITMGGYECLILNSEPEFISYMDSLRREIDAEKSDMVFDERDKAKLDYCIGKLDQISKDAHRFYQENKIILIGYC